jgi:hypothetical protein
MLRTNANNAWSFSIDNYASTTTSKSFNLQGIFYSADATNYRAFGGLGGINTNSAISSLRFTTSFVGGNFSTGTVLLYGVK